MAKGLGKGINALFPGESLEQSRSQFEKISVKVLSQIHTNQEKYLMKRH